MTTLYKLFKVFDADDFPENGMYDYLVNTLGIQEEGLYHPWRIIVTSPTQHEIGTKIDQWLIDNGADDLEKVLIHVDW